MEKQVKGYTRKGKNSKTIVVKAHTRKCNGASCGKDAGKEFSKKKGESYMDNPKTPVTNTLVHLFGKENEQPFTKEEKRAYEKKHGFVKGGKFRGTRVFEKKGRIYRWDFWGRKMFALPKAHSDEYFARRNKGK